MRMSSTVDQFKFSEWKSLSIVKTLDRADEFGKRTPVDIRREEQENPGKVIKSLSGTQKTRLGFRIPLRKVPKKVTIIISKREESKRWWGGGTSKELPWRAKEKTHGKKREPYPAEARPRHWMWPRTM